MLVLGRRPGEGVVIGGNIKVCIVVVDGEMKLTIDAPRDIPVVRSEVYERKCEQNAISEFMES